MGRRTSSETATKILIAFLDKPTWKQAELARRAEVTPRTIRKQMLDLMEAGVPIVSEKEPPHVYWSVPHGWFPSGQLLGADRIAQLSRLLARHPKTEDRERLLSELLRSLPSDGAPRPNPAPLAGSPETLSLIEDAAAGGIALDVSYLSARQSRPARRHISVHRIDYAPVIRVVATCHRDGCLKWFRADRVGEARLDPREPHRPASSEAVDAFVRGSFAGFRGSGETRSCEFELVWPAGRWAVRNLPSEAVVRHVGDHVHVTIETSGVEALARHLVGLGELARAITPELRELVVGLARGALGANSAAETESGP